MIAFGHGLQSIRCIATIASAAACLSGLFLPPVANAHADKTWKPAQVIAALRGAGHPIIKVRYYTPASDPNKLLGRPGQYIGKANFRDRRTHESGFDVSSGGSVETFANKTDASRRFQYVKVISESSPLFVEYDYLEGTVVLRVSSRLTPVQAKAYEKTFRRVV